ncbi:hypothetical protein MAP00_005190 [Monascus purpureus]|nr:hypothetical protein MAP00_005190 [Monascus purpureus]
MTTDPNPSSVVGEIKAEVDAIVERLSQKLRDLNRTIWENPEIGKHEFNAHNTICSFMEELGYTVTRSAYGIPTAFEVLSGSGGRLVNFNAEYDSLPGIGHACGHNLITTSSVTAFLSLSMTLKRLRMPGRVQLLGTPDEEGDGGKVKLLERGAYKNVDVSLMAHPFEGTDSGDGHFYPDGIAGFRMVARERIAAEFIGKAAHAGSNPWDGVNALDAAVAAYNNLALLRQQIQANERIHNVFVQADKTVNIIPAYVKCAYQVRSPRLSGLKVLVEKVTNCIKAAGLATGCEVKIQSDSCYADIVINDTLCDLYKSHIANYGHEVQRIIPVVKVGSTDQGNVSHQVPAIHAMFVIPTENKAGPHSKGFEAGAGTDIAHERALVVGKTLAQVGYDVLTKDKIYEAVKADWLRNKASY